MGSSPWVPTDVCPGEYTLPPRVESLLEQGTEVACPWVSEFEIKSTRGVNHRVGLQSPTKWIQTAFNGRRVKRAPAPNAQRVCCEEKLVGKLVMCAIGSVFLSLFYYLVTCQIEGLYLIIHVT